MAPHGRRPLSENLTNGQSFRQWQYRHVSGQFGQARQHPLAFMAGLDDF
jgi:hypothetical protein